MPATCRWITPRITNNKRSRKRANGSAAVARPYLSLKERDVQMWRRAPMTGLIQHDGRVLGAYVTYEGKTLRIKANEGVIR